MLRQRFSTCGWSNNPFTGVAKDHQQMQISIWQFITVENNSYEIATKISLGLGDTTT